MENRWKNKTENEISNKIISCALEVHRLLGPGLLESTYRDCLLQELKSNNLDAKKEYSIPLYFKGIKIESGYRMDIFVEDKVIVELKAVDTLHDIFFAQTYTYLKITNCKLALLINFNVRYLKDGIKRVVNKI